MKSKVKSQKSKVSDQRSKVVAWAVGVMLALSSNVLAIPTDQDVMRSISKSMNEPADTGRVLAVLLGASVVTVTAIVLSQRKREKAKRALNSPKKLIKEVVRQMDVPGREMRQFRAAAAEKGLSSPLVAMLCPSVMAEEPERGGTKRG